MDPKSVIAKASKVKASFVGVSPILSSSSSLKSDPQLCLFNPLETYFDFGYYLFAIPFRFRKELSTKQYRQYTLETSKTRKIISLIIFILSLLYYITSARNRLAIDCKLQAAVITYFNYGHSLLHISMLICYFEVFVQRSENCQRLMEELGRSIIIHCGAHKVKSLSIVLHLIAVTGLSVLQFVDWAPFYSKGVNWSFENGFLYSINLARYTFFIDTKLNEKITTINAHCLLDYVLGIVELALLLSYTLTSTFSTMIYLYAPIFQWIRTKEFVERVIGNRKILLHPDMKSSNDVDVGSMIVERFNEVLSLADAINSTWGTFFFVSILDYIVWLATDLDLGIKTNDLVSKFSSAWYFSIVLILLISSSESTRMMSKFKTWMIRKGKKVFSREEDWGNLLTLVDTQTLGIGIDGLYHVNYSFTGQITTIIITFFIITLPFDKMIDQLS